MRNRVLTSLGGLLALVVSLVFAPPSAAAQAESGTVAGQITEQGTNAPLVGARVFLGGTNRSAVTNAEGRFTIAGVPVGTHEIRVSLLGYVVAAQQVNVTAGSITTADFIMKPSAVSLDALTITATGEQARKELGTTVGHIDAPSLVEQKSISNLGQLLNGRTSNVQVLPSSGTVGTGTRVRIRGLSSVSLSNEPVYYIDGIRMEAGSSSFTVGTGGQSISRINDLNPEEIESVEVVKGPSASTLYGTQAANGVIRITTKRGRAGRTSWTAYTQAGLTNDRNSYPTNYFSWGRVTAAGATPTIPAGTVNQCLIFPAAAAVPTCVRDSLTSFNVLESDLGINGTGYSGQAGLQVSGGNDAVRYFLSGEYNNEIGHIRLPDSEYKRITALRQVSELPYSTYRPNALDQVSLRSNLDATLSRRLDVSLKTGLSLSDIRLPQNDNNVTGILPSGLFGKGWRGTRAFGSDYGFFRPGEVFAILAAQDLTRFTGAANAQWRATENITARATVGLDYGNRLDQLFQGLDQGPAFSNFAQGRVQDHRTTLTQYTFDLNATGSFNLSSNVTSKTSIGAQWLRDYSFRADADGIILTPGGQTVTATSQKTAQELTAETITLGTYIEEVIALRDRLFLTGALRLDGNSAFGNDFSAVAYPKFQLSWVASDESFFPQGTPLNNLRLRFAYGASGLQPGTTDAIAFLNPITATIANVNTPGFTPASLGNPNLKPERSAELELGADFGLFQDKASLELTYYRKKTRDALIQRPQAPSLGNAANQFENLGGVLGIGYEGALNFTVAPTPSMSIDVTISASRNSNWVLKLGGVPAFNGGNNTRIEVGYPVFGYWDRPILGYRDKDNDGVIEFSATDTAANEIFTGLTPVFLGYSIPRNEASFNLGISLFDNRIRLAGQLDYRGGFKQNNFTEFFRCTSTSANNCRDINDPTAPLDRQARAIAARTAPRPPAGSTTTLAPTAAGYIEDADFLKFRELSLTFYAPEPWARALRATRLNITIAGRNLRTWTGYSGIDPELNGSGQGDAPIDFLTQPQVTAWTFRVNLGF